MTFTQYTGQNTKETYEISSKSKTGPNKGNNCPKKGDINDIQMIKLG